MSLQDNDVVKFKALHELAILPEYATDGAAACDLASCEATIILPGSYATIHTGMAIELPPESAALVLPRSGLSARHGISVLNAPGLIDSDYRGEVKVLLINHGKEPFSVKRGSRIAQLLFIDNWKPYIRIAKSLSDTSRGEGGFGSTGV